MNRGDENGVIIRYFNDDLLKEIKEPYTFNNAYNPYLCRNTHIENPYCVGSC